jgi:hypothetical protein
VCADQRCEASRAGGGGGAGGVMAGFLQFSFHSLSCWERRVRERGERRGQFNINSLLAGSSAKAWDENFGVNGDIETSFQTGMRGGG